MSEEREMSRRIFIRESAILVGSALAANTMAQIGCVASAAPTVRVDVLGNRVRVDTARQELLRVGDGIQLDADALDYPILLIRLSDQRFVALSTECMHLGCRVKKQPVVIRCPCHGSVYDLEGKVLNGPTERPLKQYPVRLDGPVAHIELVRLE